ncbi:MAG: VCBS repeat-containing protein [Isosphaeraceae bacterium]|nr:VCBS repeat-containing protein [Isosphaeraceae bacterium]
MTTLPLVFCAAFLPAALPTTARTIPTWTHLSSKSGDLPAPGTSNQQTACLVLDVDKDGLNDIVIASRSLGARMVWYRRNSEGWSVYPIDEGLQIEAGGAVADIDRDGDLDLVFGEDWSGTKVYWWENPYPRFDAKTPWVRREIKNSKGEMHHDQLFGDFDGDGKEDLAFWVQRFQGLILSRVPDDPKSHGPWPSVLLADIKGGEGLAKADIDGDGQVDLVGAGYWFKHRGGLDFEPLLIDEKFRVSRTAAGQLVEGGRPEVVFVIGDGVGRLKWFEQRAQGWVGHDLLGEDVVRGHSLELADVNQDGHLDIFCAEMAKWTDLAERPDHPSARMWIFYGDGHGQFHQSLIATGIDNHESRVADLDGDGDLDIVSKPYNSDTPRLDIWLNGGTGTRKNSCPDRRPRN